MWRMIENAIKGSWNYFWGHFFGALLFDKCYLRGRWFTNKYHGFGSEGWTWVTHAGFDKLFRSKNVSSRFPVGSDTTVIRPNNVFFDPDDLNNFQSPGSYFQAIARISIGRGTYIAPNVGIITSNHDPNDPSTHLPAKEIIIGDSCWIGMNAVLLPGVILGARTTVGAGAVVTKSFPEGNCVIAGNPGRLIRKLDKSGKDK